MKYLTLFYYGIESRYPSSDEHCAVLSGHSRLYKALGIEVMVARIIRKSDEHQSLSSEGLLGRFDWLDRNKYSGVIFKKSTLIVRM